MRVGGVVLCGGQSSRMGRPKAWLPFAGELMLPRVVRLLRGVAGPIVVVAAPGQGLPPLPAEVEVARDPEPGLGPLQGLAVGLRALEGKVEAAYATSCDVPFLDPAFVRFMIAALGDQAIAVPEAEGYRHPLAAVYRAEVGAMAARLLAEGKSRPAGLFAEVPTRVVTAEEIAAAGLSLATLRNVNTPEEYAAAVREWEGR